MITQTTLDFLKKLDKNNNRTWFHAHRPEYEAAKQNFEELVEKLIDKISTFENLGILTPKECLFRINRDIRFSHDKRPYKDNFGAAIAKGGKKNLFGSFYIHLQPGESFVGGGLYHPDTKTLNKFRDYILEHPKKFLAIAENTAFKKYFGPLAGETLKRVPSGYSKDMPLQHYLMMKSLTALHHLPDRTLTSKGLEVEIINGCKLLSLFLALINESQK